MDLSKIDENFLNFYSLEGMKGYNIKEKPFKIYGNCADKDSGFKRLPHNVAAGLNDNIKALYECTSGIRVRFKTDSTQIVLACKIPDYRKSTVGRLCFDLYADNKYCNVLRPGFDINGGFCEVKTGEDGFCSGFTFGDNKMREILINFPLYEKVDEVVIFLKEGAQIQEAAEYTHKMPVIYYGSSITQGGCASHSGNAYPNIISRRLDCDFINLGFSAGCFGEIEMAKYISSLEKSILVYDYDHNARTAEKLKETHEPFFKEIRKNCPNLPVIIVSAADAAFSKNMERKGIIKATFDNAVKNGDKNVYFIDGADIYRDIGVDYCTEDHIHPNDLGFWCMANSIGRVIDEILNGGE